MQKALAAVGKEKSSTENWLIFCLLLLMRHFHCDPSKLQTLLPSHMCLLLCVFCSFSLSFCPTSARQEPPGNFPALSFSRSLHMLSAQPVILFSLSVSRPTPACWLRLSSATRHSGIKHPNGLALDGISNLPLSCFRIVCFSPQAALPWSASV